MRVQCLWEILVVTLVTLVTIGTHSKRMDSRLYEVDVSHKQRFFLSPGGGDMLVTDW